MGTKLKLVVRSRQYNAEGYRPVIRSFEVEMEPNEFVIAVGLADGEGNYILNVPVQLERS